MLLVHGRKKIIILAIVALTMHSGLKAQMNLRQYDTERVLHFGFSINGLYNNLQLHTSPEFLDIDTLKNIRVEPFYGFGLGAVVDLRMGRYFNLRFLGPNISFVQRNLYFDFDSSESRERPYTRKVEMESVYLDFPLEIKFKSERHWNTRFYVVGGAKYTYDLASEIDAPRSLNDPIVALKPNSWSYTLGFGMDLYFPYFKLSPEIKLSQSFNNVMVRDDYVYTKSLQSIYSRMVVFSLHFE